MDYRLGPQPFAMADGTQGSPDDLDQFDELIVTDAGAIEVGKRAPDYSV